ncbi:MAG: hypothetical protein R3174_14505, partial [Gammaproteobacteria bacterium]|nr:hypothetical protein [Gammaproteobacteria bacterium]
GTISRKSLKPKKAGSPVPVRKPTFLDLSLVGVRGFDGGHPVRRPSGALASLVRPKSRPCDFVNL